MSRFPILRCLGITFILLSSFSMASPSAADNLLGLTGTYIATGYTCGATQGPELVRVNDDGLHVQAIKLRGDQCVTTGAVTFFYTRNVPNLCVFITGTTSSANSGVTTCSGGITVVNATTFQLNGITYKKANNAQISGIVPQTISCKNNTTGAAAVPGTIIGSTAWSCDRLTINTGDIIVQTVTGKAQ